MENVITMIARKQTALMVQKKMIISKGKAIIFMKRKNLVMDLANAFTYKKGDAL